MSVYDAISEKDLEDSQAIEEEPTSSNRLEQSDFDQSGTDS